MVSLQPCLDSLLQSLPPHPVEEQKLNELVGDALMDASRKSSSENRKIQWEYLLKNEVFNLAATEGKALKTNQDKYYDDLRGMLDLALVFTEHDACEQTFPFVVLQDLLETQTIASCSHIFSWIELRTSRLTEGMVPQKGKALILLRTLNDLLRRLSKMGSTTIFCGRILTFLSGVFPLGERSGVNLRGEYGPSWEGVKFVSHTKQEDINTAMDVDENIEATTTDASLQDNKMQVDGKDVKRSVSSSADKKEDFYNTFWSLQLPFSKPTLFASKNTFEEFKEAINNVMPVIKEATAKERAMMGSRAGSAVTSSLKRKREPDSEETNINEYFFAKFLTSQELLDLEIADTYFRRQFLFQLLILLQHLLTFTKSAKANWSSIRNRSLQMDFTLEPAEATWVQESINKVTEELRQTTPNGRAFADTVSVILEREKNWVKWKNELCAPFDREPWSTEVDEQKVGLWEGTRAAREKMRDPPEDWPWRLGSEPLTDIWDMGYRDLEDLANPFQPGEVKDFVKKVKQEDARIEMRKKTLARNAERLMQAQAKVVAAAAAAAAASAVPVIEDKEPAGVHSDTATVASRPESNMNTVSTSRAVPALTQTIVVNSPLHPSLPPRPGSPVKRFAPSNDTNKAMGQPATTTTSTTPQPSITNTTQPTASPIPVIVTPPAPASTPTPALVLPSDDQITKFEENKQRWAWLALRTARDQYLQHFGKIGTGDIIALTQEIEKEKQERDKNLKGEEASGTVVGTAVGDENAPGNLTAVPPPAEIPISQKFDGDGDVKMEER